MAKMNKKWVILCSTAVAAVYAAGYFTTETQASIQQQPQHTQINIQSNGGQSNDTSINKSPTSSLYQDGTYTGMGRNRRGSIQVAVTIKNDKITDVEISDFAMHYSESDVVGMPEEVIQNQSAKVMNVSGATYSTQAFEDAVLDALSQAQNA
ncbi:FMN-binding protein [Cohnella silvisoli]|uniref:FMN-binding protein n=1 Tax=Cohnella silvisoli TaxID=2873699 RepID=A0ABV1KR34_9BACL|nr:FMN-binding protein [Cohnella silvisoli]MCD9021999.1 FMN-binding protein [Cohnella silvisoli]